MEDEKKILKIEINFPTPVRMELGHQVALDRLVRKICEDNTPEGYVMWPAGQGQKMTYMAMTLDEEEARDKEGKPPLEFDETIYAIDCAIKEKRKNESKKT